MSDEETDDGRWEVTEDQVTPLNIGEVAADIADDHYTTVIVTPFDEADNLVLDDQVIYQNPNE